MSPVIPDKDIQSALNTTLALAFPTMPIAWENAEYTPTVGTAYFRVWLLPAKTDTSTLGSNPWRVRTGIFQVSIFYPPLIGFGIPKGKAAEVVAAFLAEPRRLTYNTLSILILDAWPSSGNNDENGWYHIPVNIKYECHSTG